MADIASQIQDFANEFGKAQKSLFGSRGTAFKMAEQMRIYAQKNKNTFQDLTQAGRITTDGLDDLQEQIKQTSKMKKQEKKDFVVMLKTQKEVQEMTDKFVGGLSDAIKQVTKFIPFVGDKIAEGFDKKILPRLSKTFDKGFMAMFAKSGGGGLSMVKVGIWGAIALVIAGIIKAMMQWEQIATDLSKNTGFLRKDLGGVTDDMMKAYETTAKYGISMDEVQETTQALLDEFGTLSIINNKLIEQAAKWGKAYGIGATEMAGTIDVLNRGLGMSVDQIDQFVTALDTDARIAGVSMNLVMRDITKDANFLALYSDETGSNLREAAIQARKMGTSLSDSQAIADTFLDLETAMGNTMELNLLTGSDLNAMELHRLAVTGDIAGLQDKILEAVTKENKWETMNVLQRKRTAEMMGLSVEAAAKMVMNHRELAKMTPAQLAAREKELAEQESINQLLYDQQTAWGKIFNTLKSKIFPYFLRIGKWLSEKINPIAEDVAVMIDKWFPDDSKMASLTDGLAQAGTYFIKILKDGLDSVLEYYQKNWEFSIIDGFSRKKQDLSTLDTAGLVEERTRQVNLGTEADLSYLDDINTKLAELSGYKEDDFSWNESIKESMAKQTAINKTLADYAETERIEAEKVMQREQDMRAGFDRDRAEKFEKNKSAESFFSETDFTDTKTKKFAKGGIVTKPTRALIGEAGPELVIPLTRPMGKLEPAQPGTDVRMADGGLALDDIFGGMGAMQNAADPQAIRQRQETARMEAEAYRNRLREEERQRWFERVAREDTFAAEMKARKKDSSKFFNNFRKDTSKLIDDFLEVNQWIKSITGEGLLKEEYTDFLRATSNLLTTDRTVLVDDMASMWDSAMMMFGKRQKIGAQELVKNLRQTIPGAIVDGMIKGAGKAETAKNILATKQFRELLQKSQQNLAKATEKSAESYFSDSDFGDLYSDGEAGPQKQSRFSKMREGVSGAFGGMRDRAGKFFQTGVGARVGAAGMTGATAGLQTLAAGGSAKQAAGAAAMGAAQQALMSAGPIGMVVAALLPALLPILKKLPKLIWKGMKQLPKILKKGIDALFGVVFKAMNKVADVVKGIPGAVVDAFKAYGKFIVNFYKKIGSMVWKGMKSLISMPGKVISAVVKAIKKVLDKLNPGKALKGLGKKLKFWAAGGVATKPTPAIIGEEGPEVVLPLQRIANGEPIDERVNALLKSRYDSGASETVGPQAQTVTNQNVNSDNSELVAELRALRTEIAMLAQRPVRVDMDGRKVADIVATNFDEIGRQ